MIVSYPAMEHKKALFLRPDKRDFTAEDSNGTTARKGGHSKEYSAQVLRHGVEHHLYNGFRRGNVVVQDPFLRHADRAHAIKPNTVSKLGVEKIGALLLFNKLRIASDKVLQHVMP